MKESENRQEHENPEEELSFKSALYSSVLFVGGGIVLFWFLLFIAFSLRV
ncbi:cytochrome c oxidase subunit 2A [Oceanobacillus sp. CAU 1775]